MKEDDFQDRDNSQSNRPFNMGVKISYNIKSGLSASLYAGVTYKAPVGDFGATGSTNVALTYYTLGEVGTSKKSPNLVTLSASYAITLGYGRGTDITMNLFNDYTGSAVFDNYEYSFTLGNTSILSSGKVEDNSIYGNDRTNSHNTNNRHQRLGGAGIRVGNLLITSYNDINKFPLFFGMGSDQYWSAGVHVKYVDRFHGLLLAAGFDLYYGKSNNKATYNTDVVIGNQNYDRQSFFNLLLNNGRDYFSYTDAIGRTTTNIRTGYGAFWCSNLMHDHIGLSEPVEPIREEYNSDKEFLEAEKMYLKSLGDYDIDMFDYKMSNLKKNNPTFHHLYVLYKDGSKVFDLKRYEDYIKATTAEVDVQKEDLNLSELNLIEQINEEGPIIEPEKKPKNKKEEKPPFEIKRKQNKPIEIKNEKVQPKEIKFKKPLGSEF